MTIRTDAIRKVLDLIEAHPDVLYDEVEPQYSFNRKSALIDFQDNLLNIHLPYVYAEEGYAEQKALLRKVLRVFGGTWDKDPDGSTMSFTQEGIAGYFYATVFAKRDAVCERVVTGTKQVEHAYVASIASYTETVDVIEWECKSILADDAEIPAERELVDA
jgi:hypothetical protein